MMINYEQIFCICNFVCIVKHYVCTILCLCYTSCLMRSTFLRDLNFVCFFIVFFFVFVFNDFLRHSFNSVQVRVCSSDAIVLFTKHFLVFDYRQNLFKNL